MIRREAIQITIIVLMLLIVMVGCQKYLTVSNQFGSTNYPVDWKKDVWCSENIDPATNLAFSCCCYDEMENREIIDEIHRCGH